MPATDEERDRLSHVEAALAGHVSVCELRMARIETKVDAIDTKVDQLMGAMGVQPLPVSQPGQPGQQAAPPSEPTITLTPTKVVAAAKWVGAALAALGIGGGLLSECDSVRDAGSGAEASNDLTTPTP